MLAEDLSDPAGAEKVNALNVARGFFLEKVMRDGKP
jgi:hypothetical protein